MPQYDHLDINNWPSAEKDIGEFWEAQKKEYMRHYPKNGDSWKTCDLQWLIDLTERAMLAFFDDTDNDVVDNPEHLIDIANFCAFLWYRTSQEETKLRKDE